MALQAFYNLKDTKKKVILQAIMDSLKVNTYDDLSINDIATIADISRGSFYNYFLDKNDAVKTLIIEKLIVLKDTFTKTIADSGGNLFDGAFRTYELIKDACENEVVVAILRNFTYFLDMAAKITYSEDFAKHLDDLLNWLIENTEEGKSVLTSKKKMANVLDMIFTVFANTTLRMVTNKGTNMVYDDFKYKLDVIKKGIN